MRPPPLIPNGNPAQGVRYSRGRLFLFSIICVSLLFVFWYSLTVTTVADDQAPQAYAADGSRINLPSHRDGKILITGGLGYLGFSITQRLLLRDQEVIALDVVPFDVVSYSDAAKLKTKKLQFYRGDIRNHSFVSDIFKREEIRGVIHTASASEVRRCLVIDYLTILPQEYQCALLPSFCRSVNVEGTQGLLATILKQSRDVRPWFIHASGREVGTS